MDCSFRERPQTLERNFNRLHSIWIESDKKSTNWKEVSIHKLVWAYSVATIDLFLWNGRIGQRAEVRAAVFYREQDWAILQDPQTGLGWNSLLWACCASPILSLSEFSVAAILFLLLHLGMWGCVSLIHRWSDFQNHSQFSLICERVSIFCIREYNLWPQTILWLQILWYISH